MEQHRDDAFFMREALVEAQEAAREGEVPIGAVVVCDGQIVARAHNRREADADPSAHAEFTAMTRAAAALGRWRLSGCTVYVTLEPCLMCAGLMVNARVDRCVYGAVDPKGGALGSLYRLNDDARLNHEFQVTPGVLERECGDLLRTFFAELREARRAVVAPESADRLASGCGTEAVGASEAIFGTSAAGGAESRDGRATDSTDPDCARACCGAEPAAVLGPDDKPGASDAYESCCGYDWLEDSAGQRLPAGPRVLLAIDSFKGCASSAQVEAWAAEGVVHACPSAQVTCLPIADGGEGTIDAVHTAAGGELRTVTVTGPMGEPEQARYLLLTRESGDLEAVMEMAEAAGITSSPCTHEAALAASTYGVGQMMLDAVRAGATKIHIGLGGSATNDGGAGTLTALGARLLDAAGEPIEPGLAGLESVTSIDLAPALRAMAGVDIAILCDVDNPLVGARGALRVFGPQKGLGKDTPDSAAVIAECDSWLVRYAQLLTAARDACDGSDIQVAKEGARPRSLAGVPGAGAAGGLAAALLALGATLSSGVEAVLDIIGFDEAVRTADLVITGEGNMDGQTAGGKAPVGVARRAKHAHKPVVAIVGGRADDLDAVYAEGVDMVLPVCTRPMTLEQALTPDQAAANIRCAGETAVRAYLM